jgi:hypothetical protein
MGRWAQARRRGKANNVMPGVGPPPAPMLAIDGSDLVQTANGAADTGGLCRLYYRVSPASVRALVQEAPWVAVQVYADGAEGPVGFYNATEVGNGLAYSGESPESNQVHVI